MPDPYAECLWTNVKIITFDKLMINSIRSFFGYLITRTVDRVLMMMSENGNKTKNYLRKAKKNYIVNFSAMNIIVNVGEVFSDEYLHYQDKVFWDGYTYSL